MRHSKTFAALVATLGLACGGNAGAALVYDESVSGDLAFYPNAITSVALAAGQNTVKGSVTWSTTAAHPTDFDAFAFTVAAGWLVTDVRLTISLLPVGAGVLDHGALSLALAGGAFVDAEGFDIPATDDSMFDALPLGPESYQLYFSNLGGALNSGQFRTAGYEITLTLAQSQQVPEPSTLLLLGAALLVPALRRHRPGR